MKSRIIWKPSENIIKSSNLFKLYDFIGLNNKNYDQLHSWSIKNKGEFWSKIWDKCQFKQYCSEK